MNARKTEKSIAERVMQQLEQEELEEKKRALKEKLGKHKGKEPTEIDLRERNGKYREKQWYKLQMLYEKIKDQITEEIENSSFLVFHNLYLYSILCGKITSTLPRASFRRFKRSIPLLRLLER